MACCSVVRSSQPALSMVTLMHAARPLATDPLSWCIATTVCEIYLRSPCQELLPNVPERQVAILIESIPMECTEGVRLSGGCVATKARH